MTVQYQLAGLQIERLRNFRDATLWFDDSLTVLVGPNNAGKTSVLRMLDWTLNSASFETLHGSTRLTERETQLLQPAVRSGGRARRINLFVRVRHAKSRKMFGCDADGIARLRVAVRADGFCRLNLGEPRSGEKTDRNAASELLRRTREAMQFIYIPAVRSAGSSSFEQRFAEIVASAVSETAIHGVMGGTTKEYRTIKRALDDLGNTVDPLVAKVADRFGKENPSGLARDAGVDFDFSPAALVDWLATRARLRLTTGDHDSQLVPPEEVGSGLQSVIEFLALTAGFTDGSTGKQVMIGVEEPESNLHPASQRTFARNFRESTQASFVVTTHSPIVVAESGFEQIRIARNSEFFAPAIKDDRRTAINNGLLAGHAAEAVFAKSVLLVEGAGDRAFYEQLRRRFAALLDHRGFDDLAVVSVGAANAFGPWLEFFRTFDLGTKRPFGFIAVGDSDLPGEFLAGARQGGFEFETAIVEEANAIGAMTGEVKKLGSLRHSEKTRAVFDAVTKLNSRLQSLRGSDQMLHLNPVALEQTILSEATNEWSRATAPAVDGRAKTTDALIDELRDKNTPGSKAAWKRAVLANELPIEMIDPYSRSVLELWTRIASSDAADQLAARFSSMGGKGRP